MTLRDIVLNLETSAEVKLGRFSAFWKRIFRINQYKSEFEFYFGTGSLFVSLAVLELRM